MTQKITDYKEIKNLKKKYTSFIKSEGLKIYEQKSDNDKKVIDMAYRQWIDILFPQVVLDEFGQKNQAVFREWFLGFQLYKNGEHEFRDWATENGFDIAEPEKSPAYHLFDIAPEINLFDIAPDIVIDMPLAQEEMNAG